MDFRLIDSKKEWNHFVSGQTRAQFLQSFEWGEFQGSFGRRIWRVAGFKKGQQILAAQIIEHYLGFGQAYFYSPRGPLVLENSPEIIDELSNFINEKIANYGTVFLKIEGQSKVIGEERKKIVRVKSVQAAYSCFLNLQKTEEELLSKMHQKTRYNIRLAYKKNLDLKNDSRENFSDEWKLLKETGGRDKISLHPAKYYRLMDEKLSKQEDFVYKKIFVFKEDQALAVGVFIGFGDTFTYVHGASSDKERELMAPYLLQWEAIRYAKDKGYKYYDFGGVNPVDKNDFEYRSKRGGISRFKYGFGGEIYYFGATFDVVLKERAYRIFSLIKKIRRFI